MLIQKYPTNILNSYVVEDIGGDELGLITLNQKQELILKYYREGKSQRTIEKETGISRKTISRYIVKYETARQELLLSTENSNRIDQIDLITNLVEAPKYQVSNREKRN